MYEERTRALHPLVQLCMPFDLFHLINLEKNAFCVLTDSGRVQEEYCILHVPAVMLRDTTERPETTECGSNILKECDPERIVRGVELVTQRVFEWNIPKEYMDPIVSDKVV